MSGGERTVHIANFSVSKDKVSKALTERFGPCFVRDPFKPKNASNNPYGFVIFECEAAAQACLTSRRLVVDGISLLFASSNPKKAGDYPPGAGNRNTPTPANCLGSGSLNGGHVNVALAGMGNSGANGQSSDRKVKFKAVLSHSEGIDELYVQNVSGTRSVDYLNLQNELATLCVAASSATNAQKGQLYAGLFAEDMSWYRCRVIERNSDDSYLVEFIDYGNKATVNGRDLKDLTPYMNSIEPAASRYHLKDLVVRSGCASKVKELLFGWQEKLLVCEAAADSSIDLEDNDTDKVLRAALINSGCVTHTSLTSVSDTESLHSVGSDSQQTATKKRSGSAAISSQSGMGDPGPGKGADNSKLITQLKQDKATLKKQLSVSNAKISQLEGRKTIDDLNKVLCGKLSSVRNLRPKFPARANGLLNQTIDLLSDTSYSRMTHEQIFSSVLSLHTRYSNQQEHIRQLNPAATDTLDEALIVERDKTKVELCEAVKTCQQKCEDLNVAERRTQLNEALVKLSEIYPELCSYEFDGDVELTISNFLEWQASEGENIKVVQRTTEEALDALSKQLTALQQSLELDVTLTKEPSDFSLEAATSLAILALNDEVDATDMSEGKAQHNVISSLCSALFAKIGQEFDLLEDMNKQLSELQELAASIEPWLGKREPEDLDWMQKKEKKLKELRSQLRHRMADLDDLRETDEEDLSATEISDMEEQVEDVRTQIHAVLVELEDYTNKLSILTYNVFPEFAIKYPKLSLRAIKESGGYLRPLRDVTFYRDNGTTQTTFNGKTVILKTMSSPSAALNYIPDIVKQINDSSALKGYVNMDAIFFSKNSVNTYMQISSDYDEITRYLQATPTLQIQALTEFVADVGMPPLSPTEPDMPALTTAEDIDTEGDDTAVKEELAAEGDDEMTS